MSKFKVGDKVKIRDRIKVGEYYNGYDFIENMNKYKGKELEISKVLSNNKNEIKEDNGICTYTDDMLEPVTTTTEQPKYVKCVGNGDGYELKGKEHEGNTYYSDRFEIVSTINKKSTIKIRQTGNVTYATYKGVHSGEAIRKSSDDYDERIGILISVARALNIDSDKIKRIIDVLFDEEDNLEEIVKLQEENKELNDTINKIKSLLLSNDIIKDNIL